LNDNINSIIIVVMGSCFTCRQFCFELCRWCSSSLIHLSFVWTMHCLEVILGYLAFIFGFLVISVLSLTKI